MRLIHLAKCLPVRIKCFIIAALLILTYFIVAYSFIDTSTSGSTNYLREALKGFSHRSVLNLPNVVVHLDMKGSPPKLSYLKSLLQQLQELGATGLLIEYEDMFLYEDTLVNISAKSCYDKSELKDFLKAAVKLEFDIIPLVQTFGHMEHALKLAEFQHLRELAISPDSICPSQSKSPVLIEEMLRQVITFHQNIFPLKYVHIGCDEVLNINKCKHCAQRYMKTSDIYLNHVKVIREIVRNMNPEIAVLVWDDMFRDIPVNVWETVDNQIEPVYWDYRPNLGVSHINLMRYHDKFKKIWIASSFKGADGRAAIFPNMKERFSNHFRWLNLILDYKFGGETEIFTFEGIILTGWSRYSHTHPLCELLPISLPSLFLNLLLIKQFKEGVKKNEIYNETFFYDKYIRKSIAKYLLCLKPTDLDHFDTSQCYFKENNLYLTLKKWDLINTNISNAINNYDSNMYGLDFICKAEYINIPLLQTSLKWCKNYLKKIISVQKQLEIEMATYYDTNVIQEYIDFNLSKPKKIVNEIFEDLKNKYKIHTWNRRP